MFGVDIAPLLFQMSCTIRRWQFISLNDGTIEININNSDNDKKIQY